VVVGAEPEAAQPILDRVAGGEEQEITCASQLPRKLEPVAAWQHDVEHGQIGGGGENRIGIGIVGETGDRKPRPRDRLPDRLLVLDQHATWRLRVHVAEYLSKFLT
jgi:hypothetical protein